jgi:dienelactone hydrolase
MKAFTAPLLFAAIFFGCAESSVEDQLHVPVIQSEEVTYTIDGTEHHGWIAWDSTIHVRRPGVIVIHEWWGHNDYARMRARKLAEIGYTAFAIDMYGDGKTADHPDSAMAFVMESLATADRAKGRFDAAMTVLKGHPSVDPGNVAAIGYCFGGTVVLEMARAGADLAGVASFHGGLGTEHPAGEQTKAAVLVCTGAADPMIPEGQVNAFKAEMDSAGVDYKVVSYPDAVHSFTNPASDSLGKLFEMPLAYNMHADTSSWNELTSFLGKIFN